MKQRLLKKIDDVAGVDVLLAIQNDLIDDPVRGDTVAATGGAKKARVADPGRGKGKRGGFRYIYYYFKEVQVIYLLILYGKNEQDDLTKEQRINRQGLYRKSSNKY